MPASRALDRHALASACALLACLASPSVFAQTLIGGATVIQNDVRGDIQGHRSKLAVGDRLFQDQTVQTAANSLAKFVFLDLTNMALGPLSQVKLDTFVYNGDETARTVSLTAAKGAFRFISGKSQHEAYQVQTPQAVIGVRGTTYDVRVENGRTLVVLQEGAVNVCVRNSANCRELTEPGSSVSVTNTDIDGPIAPANKSWDFGNLCGPGSTSDLCGKSTQFASLTPMPPPPPPAATRPARRQQARPVLVAPPRYAEPARPRRPIRVARPTYYEDVPTVYESRLPVYGPVIGVPSYGGGYYGPRPGRRPPGMGPYGGGRFPPGMGGGGGRYPGRGMGGGGLRMPSGGGRIMGMPSRGGYGGGGGRGLGGLIR
ncbi:FecR domain-containing protein [Roseiarcaceae bacterium H3SJ34-1]|uniref:FecR family protein n=1 Tax=Terripilifer ovatus TaxID=3032367 RepID=UPI003AB983CD|nr:FecR domain-containing protein [Roseiarcaceae bacterium H3SJ34-1]